MKKLTALFAATAIALTAGLAQARDLGGRGAEAA